MQRFLHIFNAKHSKVSQQTYLLKKYLPARTSTVVADAEPALRVAAAAACKEANGAASVPVPLVSSPVVATKMVVPAAADGSGSSPFSGGACARMAAFSASVAASARPREAHEPRFRASAGDFQVSLDRI